MQQTSSSVKPIQTALTIDQLSGKTSLSDHAQKALEHMKGLTCPHARSGLSAARICAGLSLPAHEVRNVVNELRTTGHIETLGDGYVLKT